MQASVSRESSWIFASCGQLFLCESAYDLCGTQSNFPRKSLVRLGSCNQVSYGNQVGSWLHAVKFSSEIACETGLMQSSVLWESSWILASRSQIFLGNRLRILKIKLIFPKIPVQSQKYLVTNMEKCATMPPGLAKSRIES